MGEHFDAQEFIENWRRKRLENYRNLPRDVQADSDSERKVLNDGYDHRQVLELVQNGADAVLEEVESAGSASSAKIQVLFDGARLYVANTGAPLSKDGIEALLSFYSSPKRGNQIGRFGIGFKSLLRLGGVVEIFSRGASMQFDPARCQREVRELCNLPATAAAPSFRLAWPIDRDAAAVEDPQLAALDWATTVVRAEVRNPVMIERIAEQIRTFPARFVLFISSAVELSLEGPDAPARQIRRSPADRVVILHDGGESTRWRLTERLVPITNSAAREDAGDIHGRDKVPLYWAIPLDPARAEVGRFWAFFPTNTPTHVPGILNAPWKLTSGRESITDGSWNRMLMREAAAMIVGVLPTLADSEDPARALDYLPRQHERDELAGTLTEACWADATVSAIVPNANGTLRLASDLHRHASDDKALVERWCALADEGRRDEWVHPECLGGDRSARLRELAKRLADSHVAGRPSLVQAKPADWFAQIASADADQAMAVIRLAADYADSLKKNEWTTDRSSYPYGRDDIRPTLKIIPDRDGQLRCPDDIWLARPDQSLPGRHVVADDLANDAEIRRILLTTFEVRSLLDDNWLPMLKQIVGDLIKDDRRVRLTKRDWSALWQSLRSARPEDRRVFAEEYKGRVRVLRQDGSWQYPYSVLLPGEIISATDPDEQNRRMLVAADFHRNDDELLRLLGAVAVPEGNYLIVREASERAPQHSPIEEDFREWKKTAASLVKRLNSRLQTDSYIPDSMGLPYCCSLLRHISGISNARLTRALVSAAERIEPTLVLKHRRDRDAYPPVEVEHPLRWLLTRFGVLAIGDATVSLSTIMARCDVPSLERLPALVSLLPTIRSLAGSPRPQPANPEALDAFWQALTDHLATPEAIAGNALADLWRGAAADQWVPEHLPGVSGKVALDDVYVTGSADLARRARARGWAVVVLDEDMRALWQERGALDLDGRFTRGWEMEVAGFNSLSDALPELKAVLSDEAKNESPTQMVRGLHLSIDAVREPVSCLHWEGVLYLDRVALEDLPQRERLRLILTEAAAASWLTRSPSDALGRIADATLDERRRAVAQGADLPDRLFLAVAGDVDTLRSALGDGACRALPDDAVPRDVAALALDLLGPAVLQDASIQAAMQAADLRPPRTWGTDDARAFVLALGFPESFAQSRSGRLDAELLVSGPLTLRGLHPYQTDVFRSLKGMLESGDGRRRAVVSLPTGGGKTRVAVQAAVELILKPAGARRVVLWIAQTKELCEQAVQSFRQVWQNLGAEGQSLRVIRFWDGHRNPSAATDDEPTVVVASIQTLNSRFDASPLAWLAKPGLVVVDECHHAITTSYTSLLRWLDAEAPRPGAKPKEEPPLIGLSATPFRMDDDESRRLAKRFDQRQYPEDQEGLTERLLAGGYLAHADYRPLETNATVSTELIDELDRLWGSQDEQRFKGVLERVNKELAGNDSRNARLIETLQASEAEQILFFTNSVQHAGQMAARLCRLDIPAAAVSSKTPAIARRWFLDRFKAGQLRVLCNYNVLATGFDAPRTDLVLIARQVKSPVSYMQMVGRGLRGPENGGTETCTILTVLDNLGRFRERHPFHYCRDLYRQR
ncbi:DEAD/DEAH box helicase [Thiohalocapsa sp. ML1]|uniref:DEAD/DEAH box helicase n=1 Tax=Thiohalocapsa sp. ML1 TaxID=1431688 RepID=UPI0009E663A7|nr:DEAD/DEAH box helicase [Thiohalocapsa sp. ML1]